MTPEVAVVIPTKGRPELVRRAVEAVQAQRYEGLVESVVVSDGEMLEPSALPRGRPGRPVRLMANERTPGPSGARNTGVLASRGTYIAFCDDDDLWRPGKLAAQVAALEQAPHLSGVSCTLAVHLAGGKVRLRRSPRPILGLPDLLRTRPVHLHLSAIACRRDLLVGQVGLFDEGIPGGYGEDYDWLLRLAAAGPIRSLTEPLVDVAWMGGSWFAGRWDLIASAILYLLAKHPELRRHRAGRARLEGRLAYARACSGYRAEARRWAVRALASDPFERRSYLALLVTAGVPSAGLARISALMGRGL
jgi:GT2 family glycosyltransferase